MATTEQTSSKGRFFRILTFLVAMAALIIAIIVYFRVQERSSSSQNYIASGAVSLQSFDPTLAQKLESVMTYYETDANTGNSGSSDSDNNSDSSGTSPDAGSTDGESDTTISQGTQGLQGAQGSQGIQGERGVDGVQGPQGLQGEQGEKGDTGAQGEQGETGEAGTAGVTATVLGNGLAGGVTDQSLNLELVTKDGGGIEVGAGGIALRSDCSNQQILKYSDGSWVCSVDFDTNTTYTAGAGLSLFGSSFRIAAPTCDATEKLLWNGSSFTCATDLDTVGQDQTLSWDGSTRTLSLGNGGSVTIDDTNTTYSAGQGLSLSGTTFSLDLDGVASISSPSTSDQILINTGDGVRKISRADLFGDFDGVLNYRGTWNASTNTPDLTTECTQGYYYVVSDEGSTNLNGITDWGVNDWAVCNGTEWQQIVNTIYVDSVFGRTGAITAENGDYNASQITFSPGSGITANNLQDALQQVKDGNLSSDLPDGTVLVGDANNTAQAVTLSGDATVNNAGVVTIADGAITASKLAPGAINSPIIADGSITSDKIANGAVTFADWNSNSCSEGQIPKFNGSSWGCGTDEDTVVTYIAGNGITISETNVISATLGDSIDSSEIENGAVTTVHLADSSITSQKILNGTIQFADWASNGCTEGQIPRFDGSKWDCASLDEGDSGSASGASVSRSAPLASAQAGTEITLGELSFRYNSNANNGNLEVRSSSASTVALRAAREERYEAATARNTQNNISVTAPANTGAYTTINGGNANPNEILIYQIWTAERMYNVRIANFQGSNINIWAYAN